MFIDINDPSLTMAITSNQFSFFRLMREWPQLTIHEDADLWWLESDIPFAPLNGAWHTHLNPDVAEATIQAYLQQAGARGVPVLWWVSPLSQPDNLGDLLEKHGFTHFETVPGMAVDLGKLDGELYMPANLEIRQIRDRETLARWGEVFIKGGDLPDFMLEPSFERVLYSNPDSIQTYMAWLDGIPVGTSQMVLADGVAGIYNLGTLPQMRHQGIGSLMTKLPLLEAKSRGYKTGVLTASSMAVKMYAALGFEEKCQIKLYSWPKREE